MSEQYVDYWERMKLREEFNRIPKIPVKRWYYADGLNEIEEIYFNEMKSMESIIEIGSGTNVLKKKFRERGFKGVYHTMDLNREFLHDYHAINEIDRRYDGILILEVIEHMDLDQFWKLLDFIENHLSQEGKVAISAPNASSIVLWESWDMTHIQHYPLHDLYTLFRLRGFTVRSYRVLVQNRYLPIKQKIRLFLRRVFCYILGVDYTHGVALILQKKASLL